MRRLNQIKAKVKTVKLDAAPIPYWHTQPSFQVITRKSWTALRFMRGICLISAVSRRLVAPLNLKK
jgi:hypothetical protein